MTDDTTQDPDAAVLAEDGKATSDNSRFSAELAALTEELATAKQEVLYAKAETQNVRRRLEKDIVDARAYAATSFARDMLSVADNLARALEVIPAELREDEKLKPLKQPGASWKRCSVRMASAASPRWACHSTPTSTRR